MNFLRQSFAGLRMLLIFTLVLGLAYPALVWGVGQIALRDNANGSLVTGPDGDVVGSALIGQGFDGEGWFWSRPSANNYDGLQSGASNLGPNDPALAAAIEERIAVVGEAPADALTASASGLDPHISPEYAYAQVDRVAGARGLDSAELRAVVDQHVQGRDLGFLGEARVNVLELNLAVEQLAAGVTG